MSQVTIPVTQASHRLLRQLEVQTGKPANEILDLAIEEYRRKIFLDSVNNGYAELRKDPEQWAEVLADRQLWDATLMDGLPANEQWTEDGECINPDQSESNNG